MKTINIKEGMNVVLNEIQINAIIEMNEAIDAEKMYYEKYKNASNEHNQACSRRETAVQSARKVLKMSIVTT